MELRLLPKIRINQAATQLIMRRKSQKLHILRCLPTLLLHFLCLHCCYTPRSLFVAPLGGAVGRAYRGRIHGDVFPIFLPEIVKAKNLNKIYRKNCSKALKWPLQHANFQFCGSMPLQPLLFLILLQTNSAGKTYA